MRPTPPSPVRLLTLGAALTLAVVACAERGAPPTGAVEAGSRVAITVAPLSLGEVSDVQYTLTVTRGAETVWTRQVTSSAFGDGQGSLSYVGPCDASAATNTVTLKVDALLGPGGAALTDWADPGPISKPAACAPDRDTAVRFDLTLARAARQGFFDFAISFDDVFCSAKLDCVDAFLHNGGARDTTLILALACTTGAGTSTILHLDTPRLSCTDGTSFTIDPTLGPGNTQQTSAHVYQVATYRGAEALAPYEKCYWNTAIGLDLKTFTPGSGVDCTLTARASASQIDWPDGRTPEGATWPYVAFDVQVVTDGALSCGQHPLDASGGDVATAYAHPDSRRSFAGTMACGSCAGDGCVASLRGLRCAGSLAGVGDPVTFRPTPAGVVVSVAGVDSAAMPLPAGYTLEGCCADPCCAE